jgi:hypothetical protein
LCIAILRSADLAHALAERPARRRFARARRPAHGDQRLRLPIVGQRQRRAHDVGAEQRRAHPARAQPFGGRGEQQVLHRHRGALDRHHALGIGARGIGITVHVGQGQADRDDGRRVRDPRMRARDILGDRRRIVAVAHAVLRQPRAHRAGQPVLGRNVAQHGEAPGLAVMRRRRPAGRLEQPVEHSLGERRVLIAPDRAPLGNQFGQDHLAAPPHQPACPPDRSMRASAR